uniref:Uncharacterized protein n=1 Tax=Uncultured archaeon GZfos26G2 TaxID=3386331 RepID=Q648I0_UNCAG|nr:hypothetical protein GZ37D1_44 [uncultured archaeon GZfos37D1]
MISSRFLSISSLISSTLTSCISAFMVIVVADPFRFIPVIAPLIILLVIVPFLLLYHYRFAVFDRTKHPYYILHCVGRSGVF